MKSVFCLPGEISISICFAFFCARIWQPQQKGLILLPKGQHASRGNGLFSTAECRDKSPAQLSGGEGLSRFVGVRLLSTAVI